jgi:3-keto-L-gulonate-6-phosphate decarboxylase
MKMLKKSLITVAILAIVLPALAGDTTTANKYHKNWPGQTVKTWNYQDVRTINVVMDVGYWIEVKMEGDIEVQQDAALAAAWEKSVFETYSGCLGHGGIDVKTNFHAALKGKAEAKSDAGGEWKVTIGGGPIFEVMPNVQTNEISVCVTGKDVKIQKLDAKGGVDNYRVALVTIQVIPWDFKDGETTYF